MKTRLLPLLLVGATLGVCAGCTNQNPDQLREKTAQETAALKRDTKAVAEGVKEGLSGKKDHEVVDINKASKEDLESLPGIDSAKAERIIGERPYAGTHQLVTRHVLTEEEYSKIQGRVVVK
jgi:DNA uptake protein ComE-like DNA-binding protein